MKESLNVMIVDDSWLTIKKLASVLEEMGHQVVASCENGHQARDKYEEMTPDLVTMDITMPETNGIEATNLILQDFPDAKIVIVTSHGQEQMVMDAVNAGALGYVLKPFRVDNLKETIERVFP